MSDPSPVADDDEALMVAIAAGRREAFEALVERHHRWVVGLAERSLGSRADARDVAQEVFLAVWTQARRYRPGGKLKGYLMTLTLNMCRARRRRGSLLERLGELLSFERPAPAPVPAELLERDQLASQVREAVSQLPSACRDVVVLRFTHDLKLEEISEVLQLPVNTVKSHLRRGLQRLVATMPSEGEAS